MNNDKGKKFNKGRSHSITSKKLGPNKKVTFKTSLPNESPASTKNPKLSQFNELNTKRPSTMNLNDDLLKKISRKMSDVIGKVIDIRDQVEALTLRVDNTETEIKNIKNLMTERNPQNMIQSSTYEKTNRFKKLIYNDSEGGSAQSDIRKTRETGVTKPSHDQAADNDNNTHEEPRGNITLAERRRELLILKKSSSVNNINKINNVNVNTYRSTVKDKHRNDDNDIQEKDAGTLKLEYIQSIIKQKQKVSGKASKVIQIFNKDGSESKKSESGGKVTKHDENEEEKQSSEEESSSEIVIKITYLKKKMAK